MTPAQQLIDDFHSVFSTEPGKRVLEQLKSVSQHGKGAFRAGLEAWQPAYRDGAQSIVQYILDKLAEQVNQPDPIKITKP